MADGTLKVGTITTRSGSGTITIGQSGETVDMANGSITLNSDMKATPAFKARLSADQTIANVTDTTVACNTEDLDTAGCYNNTGSTVTLNGISTPAYSFAPNVAGKYFIYGGARFDNAAGTGTLAYVLLKKNSTNSFIGIRDFVPYGGFFAGGIFDMDGSSDTATLTVYQNTGSSKIIIGGSTGDALANFGAYRIIGA